MNPMGFSLQTAVHVLSRALPSRMTWDRAPAVTSIPAAQDRKPFLPLPSALMGFSAVSLRGGYRSRA